MQKMQIHSDPFSYDKRIKPVLKWAGGKSSLLPQFFPFFPKTFHRYIEPFLGGAAVFLSLHKETPAIVNELNEELFHLYTVLKNHPQELCDSLDHFSTKYSEDFFYELRENTLINPVENAARTIFLNKTCYNGLYRQNSLGKFNVPFGKKSKCPTLYNKENILRISAKLNTALILNDDFEAIIRMAQKGDFIYCDPPYEPLSATSSFKTYYKNGFSQQDQIRLLQACIQATDRGAIVAISNSIAPFILNLYKDFKIHTVSAKRLINSQAAKRGKLKEALVIIERT